MGWGRLYSSKSMYFMLLVSSTRSYLVERIMVFCFLYQSEYHVAQGRERVWGGPPPKFQLFPKIFSFFKFLGPKIIDSMLR